MTRRPPLATGRLVAHTEAVAIRVPRDDFWRWFVDTPLEAVLPGGGSLPGVVGTEPAPGPVWGEPGAGRRVHLSDGTAVSEAITEAAPPGRFAYQVWEFERLPGLLLAQALGRFAFDDAADGTRVTWTYAFAPRAVWLRPVVSLFVRRRFAAFMRSGLGEMRTRAEAAHAEAA